MSLIPRWIAAGAAAGLLSLGFWVGQPWIAEAGAPRGYRYSAPPANVDGKNIAPATVTATSVSATSLSASSALFNSFQISTSLMHAVDSTRTILGRCDERGNTTFPQTCDQLAGLSTIAGGAGATPFTINNALVLSDTAICTAHLTNAHAGCTAIYCDTSAGALTLQTNGNCTTTSQDFVWILHHAGETP